MAQFQKNNEKKNEKRLKTGRAVLEAVFGGKIIKEKSIIVIQEWLGSTGNNEEVGPSWPTCKETCNALLGPKTNKNDLRRICWKY